MMLWSSCDKQSCENVVCNGNNTECYLGQCGCIQGFEGPNCDTYSYEKYIGNYQVSENCSTTLSGTQNNQYSMYISLGSRVDRIIINNFLGIGSIEAFINNNVVGIASQSVGATTISGNGELSVDGRQLRLEYEYSQGSQYGVCTAILTKF